jgi:Na+/melibiose symporter-like transporter
MMWLVAAMLPASLLSGIAVGVLFFFLDIYLRLSDVYPTIMLVSAPAALIGLPMWNVLSVRFERHKVAAASLVLGAIAFFCLSFASPGRGALPLVIVFYPLTVLALLGVVAIYPIIGDIADYGRLQDGEELAGLYTSIFNFFQVSVRTVSSAAGIAIVGWLGFNATATTQTPAGAFAIRLCAVILPALGLAFAGLLFWSFPLTRLRMIEVHAELAAREASQGPSNAD